MEAKSKSSSRVQGIRTPGTLSSRVQGIRTPGTLSSRVQSINVQERIIKEIESLPDIPAKLFSAFEDDLIRRFWVTKGSEALQKYMPGKTTDQIRNRAHRMGIRRGK